MTARHQDLKEKFSRGDQS